MRTTLDGRWPRHTLLGRLREPARSAMLAAGAQFEHPAGEPLLRQGERGDHAYLLINGMVKVFVTTADGENALLGVRVAGDLVGEMAALEGSERSATVTPCSNALRVQVLHHSQLYELMNRHPDIPIEIAKMISGRLRWANRRRVENISHSPRARVASVLHEYTHTFGRQHGSRWELGVPLTQAEIASLAGIRQRTVEKEIHSLRQENVVEWHYRGVSVTDLDALSRISNGP